MQGDDGNASAAMVELLAKILAAQETMTARMEAGFRDLGTRLDIIANWRGGEVLSMRDRIDTLERDVDAIKKVIGR